MRWQRRVGRGPVGSGGGELSTEEAGVSVRAVACEPAPQGGQPPPSMARNQQEEGRGPEVWAAPTLELPAQPQASPHADCELSGDLVGVVSTAKFACLPERAHSSAMLWGVPWGPQGCPRWQMASLARLFWAP